MLHKLIKICILSALCCLTLSCASVNLSRTQHAQGVQQVVQYDWKYALRPSPLKALGTHPTEFGHLTEWNNYLFAGSSDGQLLVLDKQSGKKIWSKQYNVAISAGPIVHAKFLYWAGTDGSITKMKLIDDERGLQLEQLWKVDTGAPIEGALNIHNNAIFALNANNRLFAYNIHDGSLKWKHERPRSTEFTMYGQAKPHIADNRVYVGYSDGTFASYAESNGTVVWIKNLSQDVRFKDIDAEPVVQNDKVYVANSSWGIHCLNVEDGRILWKMPFEGVRSISIHNDELYVSSNNGIALFSAQTGQLIWQNILAKDALFSSLAVGINSIYVSIQRFGIAILDRKTGNTQHIFDTGSGYTSPPVLSKNALYTFSNRGTIIKYRVQDKPL